MNNPEKCEQTCTVLLNTDPNNESAAVMMADLAFRKVILVCSVFKFYCNCQIVMCSYFPSLTQAIIIG